jgi:parallel beta-helix repeat protein
MFKIRVFIPLVMLFALSGHLFAQTKQDSKAGKDTNPGETVTAPNDLADGDLRTAPRATMQTITVGGSQSDITGFTSAAIQIAVDALTLRGGGTVELKPGTYAISAPVRVTSNVTLIGAGESTILRKIDGCRSPLAVDADYGMLKVTVRDVHGFKIGMGVQVSDSRFPGDWDVTVARIIDIVGNTLFIDQPTLRDYDCVHKGVVSNTCSVVEGVGVENVRIANLVVDGNRATNDLLGGCRGGAVYLQKADRCLIENVKATNFNGDVFDWQITKDITVRNCDASNNAGKGFHPGTGSENSLIEGCTSHNNLDGIFLCWRVKKGTFRNNTLYANEHDGISVNKKDTDNNFLNNHIYKNGHNGVWFSDYGEEDNSHRNVFVDNVIEDNGTVTPGYGFFINSNIRDITIHNNTIRDNGSKTQKAGVMMGKGALNIEVRDNKMTGHQEGDIVRK